MTPRKHGKPNAPNPKQQKRLGSNLVVSFVPVWGALSNTPACDTLINQRDSLP